MLSQNSIHDKIICYDPICQNIPLIDFNPNSSLIKISCSSHKEKTYSIKEYLNMCQNGNDLICSFCQKKESLNSFVFFCNNCQRYICSKCYYKSECNRKEHSIEKKAYKSNNSNLDDLCNKHKKSFIKYCIQCKISLCQDCLRINNSHRNHNSNEIKVITSNDLNNLENILKTQEMIFKKEKKIIYNYLEELESNLKLKKVILENYKKNKCNGNALNNIKNMNLTIDKRIYNEINSKTYENMNISDKALSLYNFNKMCGNNMFALINEKKEEMNLNKKNYLEDNKSKDVITIYNKGNLIKRIPEEKKIYSLIGLDTGNMAVGFSSGEIKIYKTDLSNENKLANFPLLLKIDRFKGRRINYLYQLKDKTLLCCTYSKIHHIELKSSDKEYNYLGTIKLTSYEIPKKIIELGDKFIVSLGEKNSKKKENLTKKKCILKIFNKINNNEQANIESDNESIKSFDSASSGWESIFSSEDELSSSEDENLIKYEELEDEYIKIYKSNKNIHKHFLCTIFDITISKNENEDFKFVASSNGNFKGGENSLSFYGITKDLFKKGYTIYICDEKIKNIACSQEVDSICFLEEDIIGVALQNFKESDFDGIAVVNVKQYKLLKFIRGLAIGILNLNRINIKKNIFFITNKSKKNIKKLNKFAFSEYLNGQNSIKIGDNNTICTLKTGARGCLELKNNFIMKSIYFAIYTFEDIFILEIKS